MQTASILIADDHPVYRQGLRRILESHFDVVYEASDSSEALDAAVARRPDVVLMDIEMPGAGGIAATKAIREQLPGTRVVMISASDDESHIMAAIEAGASSYVVKADEVQDVLRAVQCAAEGTAYLPPSIASRLLQGITHLRGDRREPSHEQLTQREYEILKLIVAGLRNRAIAQTLCISERTVGNHVANIYGKLGVADRAEAIVYAIKRGMVSI